MEKRGNWLVRIIGCELKKMFYGKRKLLFLLLFFGGVLTVLTDRATMEIRPEIEDDKAFYLSTLETLRNMPKEQREEYLRSMRSEAGSENDRILDIQMREYYGSVDFETALAAMKSAKYSYEDRKMLDILLQQLEYLKDKPQESELIYQNGWLEMFSGGGIAAVSVLGILFAFCTRVFSSDYDSGMVALSNTFMCGKKTIYAAKVCTIVIVCMCSMFLLEAVHIGEAAVRYGLSDFGAKMSSIAAFRFFPWSFSLGVAMAYRLLLKMVGLLFAIALTVVLMTIFKNALKAVFSVLMVLFAAYCLLPTKLYAASCLALLDTKMYIFGMAFDAGYMRYYYSAVALVAVIGLSLAGAFLMIKVGEIRYAKTN